jgi:hypothetical protein
MAWEKGHTNCFLGHTLVASTIGYEQCKRQVSDEQPNGLAFSCRERAAQDAFKKPAILRAKRSTATPGWAAFAPHLSGKTALGVLIVAYLDRMT